MASWLESRKRLGPRSFVVPLIRYRARNVALKLLLSSYRMIVNIAPDIASTHLKSKSTKNATRSDPSIGAWGGPVDREGAG